MLTALFKKLTPSSDNPQQMRFQQYALMGGVVAGGLLVYFGLQGSQGPTSETLPPGKKEAVSLATPFEAITPQEVWVHRIQKEAESAKTEAKAVREENQLLAKKMEMMEKWVQGTVLSRPEQDLSSDMSSKTLSTPPDFSNPPLGASELTPPVLPVNPSHLSSRSSPAPGSDFMAAEEDKVFGPLPSKILHLSLPDQGRQHLKNIDNYVPAGSYARAVLTSGVVASTALQASSQPQPILMRLVEEGHLPRGFRGTLNQNVLIGACYGDLSAERVMCRLETMAWVEENGVTVEKKVEGWIIGEDGRPGLRGDVVDRSGAAVRDTMIAGMLSGLGQFFKTESTASVYPVSPFGQTNALSGQRVLAGAATSGASNALDKLADFSIKRAEQMQPVILIASGRVVDVVFKTGVDLRAEVTPPSLTLIDQHQPSSQEKNHAAY